MQRSRPKRAFTILEMMVVMVIATVLTTIGLVGLADVIRDARYKADRTRVYQDVRKARDRAKLGMRSLTIKEIGSTPGVDTNKLEYRLGPACSLGTPWVVEYPAVDFSNDHMICVPESTIAVAANFILFKPMGSGAVPPDRLRTEPDGALVDDWGEFPDEGCLEANPSGDPDNDARACGD